MEKISKLIKDLAAKENDYNNTLQGQPEETNPEVIQNRPADVNASKELISLRRLQEAVIWSEILGEPLSKRRKSRKRR